MHSLIGVLYQQTMLEPYRRRNLRTWGLVRDSHALAAPLPYVVYSDSYNDRCYVRALAKQGFTGLLWVPEVRDADSVEALCRRTQAVIFSPEAMINCWYMKLPPWQQINKEKNNKGELMPERRVYVSSQQPPSIVAIRRRLNEDLYLNFAGMSETEAGHAILQVYVNPLVSCIWLGFWVVLFGTVICLVPNKVKLAYARTEMVGVYAKKTTIAK